MSTVRANAIVCSPFFGEAIRNYRNEVWLARSLARVGIATLRFHYSGTGQSDGDPAALSVAGAARDCIELLDRLALATGCMTNVAVGTRLGAAIAAEVAVARAPAAIVFWDAVVDGQRYLQEQSRWIAIARLARDRTALRSPTEDVTDVLGYPLGPQLRDEIGAIDLRRIVWPPKAALLVVHAAGDNGVVASTIGGFDESTMNIPLDEGFWFVGDSWVRREHDPVSRQLIEGTTAWLCERADGWT